MQLRSTTLATLTAALALSTSAQAQNARWSVGTATPDAAVSTATSDAAFQLGALGLDYQFTASGELIESATSSARLTASIARVSNPSRAFDVDLHLGGYLRPGMYGYSAWGTPLKKLKASAYVAQGGTVDTKTFRYFTYACGTLTGRDALEGAKVAVYVPCPYDVQLGRGANNRNLNEGFSSKLLAKVTKQPNCGPWLTCVTQCGEMAGDLKGDTFYCAQETKSNPAVAYGVFEHALWLPDVGTDFVFVAGGQFVEHVDGTANLTGVIARKSDPAQRFAVDVACAGRVDPGDANYPPLGSPKKELQPTAYVELGGPIDTDTFHYYESVEGHLTGLESFSGALVHIMRDGPALQVGRGANDLNLKYGAAVWLMIDVIAQPTSGPTLSFQEMGDINLVLDTDCIECADKAERDPLFGQAAGGHAFYLPGIGTDFVWATPGQFTEKSDGTATLTGTIYRASHPTWLFDANVTFSGRVDPGAYGYAPAGSPKRELAPNAYVELGGPVDTNAWRYYQATSGRLTGAGALSGALIDLSRMGPAFQVGVGANGKNVKHGASGWLDVRVKTQPTTGICLPWCGLQGDINIDTAECP